MAQFGAVYPFNQYKMLLFENKERFDTKPAKHLDNIYDFYERSSSSLAKKIRNLLNEWFDNYPESGKGELKIRFQASFSSTFYELFIHELFYKQGFTLTPHPIIEGTTKTPDFLVKGHGIDFYLEAKEATDKSESEKAEENRINILYDQINEINSPDFFLGIKELQLKTTKQPSGTKIIRFLEEELHKHNPDTSAKQFIERGLDALEPIIFEDNDLKLTISLIPKSPEARGKKGFRPIGMYPIVTTWGGSEASIKSAIKKKAVRYGHLDKPYLICINSTSDIPPGDTEIMSALFGSMRATIPVNSEKASVKWKRALDGIFLNSKGGRFTRASAILVTNVYPSNLQIARHWLVKHPFASQNLDLSSFELTRIEIQNNHIHTVKGKSVREILEIPNDWLDLEISTEF